MNETVSSITTFPVSIRWYSAFLQVSRRGIFAVGKINEGWRKESKKKPSRFVQASERGSMEKNPALANREVVSLVSTMLRPGRWESFPFLSVPFLVAVSLHFFCCCIKKVTNVLLDDSELIRFPNPPSSCNWRFFVLYFNFYLIKTFALTFMRWATTL